jgi:hypothetical protein
VKRMPITKAMPARAKHALAFMYLNKRASRSALRAEEKVRYNLWENAGQPWNANS